MQNYIHRLDSLQMYCVLLIRINYGNIENYQSMLGGRGHVQTTPPAGTPPNSEGGESIPIIISSGYRTEEVNWKCRGAALG